MLAFLLLIAIFILASKKGSITRWVVHAWCLTLPPSLIKTATILGHVKLTRVPLLAGPLTDLDMCNRTTLYSASCTECGFSSCRYWPMSSLLGDCRHEWPSVCPFGVALKHRKGAIIVINFYYYCQWPAVGAGLSICTLHSIVVHSFQFPLLHFDSVHGHVHCTRLGFLLEFFCLPTGRVRTWLQNCAGQTFHLKPLVLFKMCAYYLIVCGTLSFAFY